MYMRVHEIMINIGWKRVHEKILVSVFGIRRSRSLPDSAVSVGLLFVFFYVRSFFTPSFFFSSSRSSRRTVYTRFQVFVLLLLLLSSSARCCCSFVVEFSTGETIII